MLDLDRSIEMFLQEPRDPEDPFNRLRRLAQRWPVISSFLLALCRISVCRSVCRQPDFASFTMLHDSTASQEDRLAHGPAKFFDRRRHEN